jgi:hypothetical protein
MSGLIIPNKSFQKIGTVEVSAASELEIIDIDGSYKNYFISGEVQFSNNGAYLTGEYSEDNGVNWLTTSDYNYVAEGATDITSSISSASTGNHVGNNIRLSLGHNNSAGQSMAFQMLLYNFGGTDYYKKMQFVCGGDEGTYNMGFVEGFAEYRANTNAINALKLSPNTGNITAYADVRGMS